MSNGPREPGAEVEQDARKAGLAFDELMAQIDEVLDMFAPVAEEEPGAQPGCPRNLG